MQRDAQPSASGADAVACPGGAPSPSPPPGATSPAPAAQPPEAHNYEALSHGPSAAPEQTHPPATPQQYPPSGSRYTPPPLAQYPSGQGYGQPSPGGYAAPKPGYVTTQFANPQFVAAAPAPQQQQQQQAVGVNSSQQQLIIVTEHVDSYAGHLAFSCFVFWFVNALFGAIAFSLAGNHSRVGSTAWLLYIRRMPLAQCCAVVLPRP